MTRSRRLDNRQGIMRMWLGWLVSTGLLTALILLSLWVPHRWLPLVAFGLQGIAFVLVRTNREADVPVCYLMPFVINRVLFWSGVTMLALNFSYSSGLIHRLFAPEMLNPQIPFLVMLIVSPIAVVVCRWTRIYGDKFPFCLQCKSRNGTPPERGFLGNLFSQEGRYQVRLCYVCSLAFTIVGWLYWGFLYVNVSISRPDTFVLFIAPTLVYIAAAIFMAIRYLGLWNYYSEHLDNTSANDDPLTRLRFIIAHGGRILLTVRAAEALTPEQQRLDTPASVVLGPRERITPFDALQAFRDVTGVSHLGDTDLRLMYVNDAGNTDGTTYHYLCLADDATAQALNESLPEAKWYSLAEIDRIYRQRQLNSLLGSELHRLHTVTMAWKTYDRNGRRRYKIKSYRPTFRLEDIAKWTVDYNDPEWLYVSNVNQDRPFWRIRRFWHKYINGVE